MTRIAAGMTIEAETLQSLAHGLVAMPSQDHTLTHMSFRRFAGCPICNLHLRSLASRAGEIAAQDIATIAFFHSSAEAMRPYQGDLPFAVIPDEERRYYRRFGVERSPLSMLHPAAMVAAAKGMASVPSNPMRGEGGHLGLPADFLVDRGGQVLVAHYGAHAADGWGVEQLFDAVRAVRA